MTWPQAGARIERAVGAAGRSVEAALREFRAGADESRIRAAAMRAAIEAGADFLAREVGCRFDADRRRIEVETAVVRDGYQGECLATGFADREPGDAGAAWSRVTERVLAACRPGATGEDLRGAAADVVVRSIGTGVERPTWPLLPGMVLV